MATYRSIADSETDPKAPVTSELMKALALNPIAIMEGQSGAPKAAESWHAQSASGTGGIVFSNIALGEGVRTEITGTSSDGGANSTVAFLVEISSNGTTWTNSTTLFSYTSPSEPGASAIISPAGVFFFDRPTGQFAYLDRGANSIVSGTFTSASATTHIRFRYTDNGVAMGGAFYAINVITGGKAVA